MFAMVLGLSPTGLYVLRELGRAGVACGGVAEGLQCGEASRFLTVGKALQAGDDDAALVAELAGIARARGETGLIIPTSDRFIDFVADNREALAEHFVFQDSYTRERVAEIVDKARFLQRCAEADVPAPGFFDVAHDELAGLAGRARFPLIVKPSLIHHVKDFMAGRKVLIARDADDYAQIVREVPQTDATRWLVQEIIAGPESNILLFSGYRDRAGTVHQAFTARKLRQYPPGFGSASLVRSETAPAMREAAERLLAALDFHGIAGVEMKTDARDGELKIIEVNPRPSLWFALGTAAGRRASLAAFRDMAGEMPPPDTPQQDGHVWRYRFKDVYSANWYRRRGAGFVLPPPEIGDALRVPSEQMMGAVHAADDPGPSLREWQNYAVKGVRRLSPGRG